MYFISDLHIDNTIEFSKRKDKRKSYIKSGLETAITGASIPWVISEGLRIGGKKTPKLTKLAKGINNKITPYGAVGGLVAGLTYAAMKNRKSKKSKRK